MIAPHCFTREWLQEQADALKARDLRNLEKCVLALELTGRLEGAGLDFVFKGGTSLILLFEPARRLSIDVDILSLEPQAKLEEALQQATADRTPFLRWEHQEHRDREAPPTKHFRAFYESVVDPSRPHSIQLDVILAESPYASIERRSIQTSFVELEEDIAVPVPSPSSLLADKVAAFAPSTIGYPYQPIIARTGSPAEPRPIKVVKHLFDIGELALHANDLAETLATYGNVHAEQIQYRGQSYTIDEALDDTQDAAFWMARVDGKPREEHERIDFFRNGMRALDSHLFTQPFRRIEARIAAGRAALAAELIRQQTTTFDLPEFLSADPNLFNLAEASLKESWQNLNRLKQTDVKAFECWYQAQQIAESI